MKRLSEFVRRPGDIFILEGGTPLLITKTNGFYGIFELPTKEAALRIFPTESGWYDTWPLRYKATFLLNIHCPVLFTIIDDHIRSLKC